MFLWVQLETLTVTAKWPLPPPAHPELPDYGRGSSVPMQETLAACHICSQTSLPAAVTMRLLGLYPLALGLCCGAIWGQLTADDPHSENLISTPKVQFLIYFF